MERDEEKYCSNCKRSVAAKNFAIHSAFCERNIIVCKICKDPVAINERDEHIENYHVISPCTLCEAPIEKWMLPDHMEICPRRLIVCEYCKAEFPLNEYTQHVEFCGSRTEKCLLCQKYIMIKDQAKHSELHKYERKFHKKKIEEELKQNAVNEVMENVIKTNLEDFLRKEETVREDPETRFGANFKGMKVSSSDKTNFDSKIMQSSQETIISPDRTKEMCSRNGVCHICKQSIPWIDMNIHIPNCASMAGKCSLCGEDVQNHEMKDHMRRHMPGGSFQRQSFREHEISVSHMRNNSSDHDQNNAEKMTPKSYNEHTDEMKFSTNEYHCPLCLKMVPIKDKNRHATSDCQMLQDNTELGNTSSTRNDSQEVFECPYCLAWMPEYDIKKHELFECKTLIDSSGVYIPEPELHTDTNKKTCHCSNNKEIKNCKKCKSNCQHRKGTCCCKEKSQFSPSDEPEKHCPANKCNKNSSKHGVQEKTFKDINKPKGAIPKKTNIREMMRPEASKCKYCHTSLNMDIMIYHEEECIHQPVECNECLRRIPMKDLANHLCKKKKIREKDCKGYQVSEEKTESGFRLGRWVSSMMSTSNNKGKDEKENENRQHLYSFNYHSNYFRNSDSERSQDFYFQETLIPCEFCNKEIPASELVLHETGCEPALVSFAKQEPVESGNLDKFNAKYNSIPSYNKEESFFPKTSVLTSDHKKHQRKSDIMPGEFLQCKYDKTSSRNNQNTRNGSSFQSVWNSESYADDAIEDHSEEMSKPVEEPMDVDKLNEPNSITAEKTKHESEFPRVSSEKNLLEDDMNAILGFLEDDSSNKLDKEVKNELEVGEKRAQFVCLENANNSAIDSNKLKEHVLQKNLKVILNERNYSIDEDSTRLRESLRSVINSFDTEIEVITGVQQSKDLLLHINESVASSDKQIPVEKNLLENKDNEPEISNKHKILLDDHTKISERLTDDFKKYLPDLKFASPKEKSSSTDDENYEFCTKASERSEKIFEKQANTNLSSYNRLEDNLKIPIDFKFDRDQISTSCNNKNIDQTDNEEELKKQLHKDISTNFECKGDYVGYSKSQHQDLSIYEPEKFDITGDCNRLISENNEEKHEEACIRNITNISKHIWTNEESLNSASNSNNVTNSIHLESDKCTLKNNEHEIFLQKTIVDESAIPEERNSRNSASEIECISNYHKYFPDFKFASANEKLGSNSNNLTDSSRFESDKFSVKDTEHKIFLGKSNADESVISEESTSRNSSGKIDCISNYHKYFPDFKFAAASEKSAISKKNSIDQTMPSKKNLIGTCEKLNEQQFHKVSKYSKCIENENACGLNSLANVEYASNESKDLLGCIETRQRKPLEKDDLPEKVHLDSMSIFIDELSKNKVKHSNDFKKYLPDFKFGSQITRSEDKICIANLSDEKDQFEESALKLQADQLNPNEYLDVLEERTRKKINEIKARIACLKKLSQEELKTENQAEFQENKWRKTSNSGSSDNE